MAHIWTCPAKAVHPVHCHLPHPPLASPACFRCGSQPGACQHSRQPMCGGGGRPATSLPGHVPVAAPPCGLATAAIAAGGGLGASRLGAGPGVLPPSALLPGPHGGEPAGGHMGEWPSCQLQVLQSSVGVPHIRLGPRGAHPLCPAPKGGSEGPS